MNKTLIALSAAAVIGSVSAAFAYEAPENRIGDQYPFLEQTYKPTVATRFVGGTVMPRQAVNHSWAAEVPENRIGDRYPALEQGYQPIAASKFVSGNVTRRQVMNYGVYSAEAPENRIGDRYPLLEQAYSTKNVSTGRVMTVRINKNSKI